MPGASRTVSTASRRLTLTDRERLLADAVLRTLLGQTLEGRRLVAFGDVGGVECALGVDAARAVLFPGSVAHGHHKAAIGRQLHRWGSG